jgi:hypothetical protein
MITGYSQRAIIAIENPEPRPPKGGALCSSSAFTREVRRYQRDASNVLQFVTILTVDEDSPYVWHARVGFLEPTGEYADRQVPLRTYTDEMHRMAMLARLDLLRLPHEDIVIKPGVGPKGNPTEYHAWVPLTQFEVSWMKGVQSGAIPRTIALKQPEVIEA